MTMTSTSTIDLARLLAPEMGRSAEMESLYAWILAEDAKLPDPATLTLDELRRQRAGMAARHNIDLPEVAEVVEFKIPGRNGGPPVPADVTVPHNALPGAILYLPGGGWAFGGLRLQPRFKRLMARQTRRRVVGLEYRLAPENPFPAGLDDSVAAWHWLVDAAGRDPAFAGPLGIMGDSAGANLAVATMLHESAADRRLPDAAMLFYGVYSADLDSPSYLRFAEGYGLTRAGMSQYFDWYVGADRANGARRDPLVAPVEATEAMLRSLPPIFLNAASLDPLLCDTLSFAARLDAAGAAYELVIHEGVHHGFMQWTAKLEESRRAVAQASDFFNRRAG